MYTLKHALPNKSIVLKIEIVIFTMQEKDTGNEA